MKKILSLVLALTLVLGSFGLANAATGNTKIDWLVDKGYLFGDAGTGDLRLKDSINRAEVAAMVIRVLGFESISESLKSVTSTFKDMNSPDVVWARGYVNLAAGNGIVSGYPDGTYKPKNQISYEEVITMLVSANGDLPNTSGNTGHWSLPYISKAIELGITDGITIPDYTAKATREKVFEMVYNTVIKKVAVENEVYKGIVVESSRVSTLDDKEISFIVFEEGNNPSNAALRYDKYDEVRITLPSSVGDAENLLGKVIDITIDKNNNASKVVVDTTYSYLEGTFLVRDGDIYDGTTGKTYNVFLEDRYSNTIEKIFGAFHNDKEYSYRDLVRELTRSEEGIAEFARVTMKGNRIYFIDAFNFSDVAPVSEVKRSGDEVYYYNDYNNAAVAKFVPESVIGYTKKDGFKSIDKNDIQVNDIIHIYDRNKAIVRQDAEFTGEFERILESSSYFFARIEGEQFQIRETNYKKPVYSIDGSRYFTLNANTAQSDLSVLRNEDVVILLDINQVVQSIVGDTEFNEGVAAIDDISRRTVDIVNPNGSKGSVSEEYDSKLLHAGSNTQKSLSDFNRGDIVYLFKDGNVIDEMVRIATASQIDSNAKKVAKTSRGDFDINLAGQRTGGAWVRLDTLGIVNISSTTNVFIVDVDGSRVTRVEGTNLEYILDTAKSDSDLKAYVISERDFTNMNLGNSIRVGNATDVAHTIIFTDYVLGTGALNFETIEVTYRFNSSLDDEIIGEDVEGRTITRKIESYVSLPNLSPGDIVTLGVSKDSAKLVKDIEVKIAANAEEYEVVEVDRFSSKGRWIKLEDDKGKETELFISSDALFFGYDDVYEGDNISYSLDADGDIDVIKIR